MKDRKINYSTIIKEARQSRGINQETLAMRTGVGKTTISNYETGYSTPSAQMLEKIAFSLDYTLIDMITLGAKDSSDLNLPRTFQGVNDVFVPYIRPENVSLKTLENQSYMDSYVTLAGFMLSDEGNYICLKANDNSMDGDGICKNDYVFVRKSHNICDYGIVLAVNLQSDKYIIRRYRRDDHIVSLVPSSCKSEYSIISYDENYPEYRIIGYVEKVLSNIK